LVKQVKPVKSRDQQQWRNRKKQRSKLIISAWCLKVYIF